MCSLFESLCTCCTLIICIYETNRYGGTNYCFKHIAIIDDIVCSNFLMPCLISLNGWMLLRFMSYICVLIGCNNM